MSRASTFSPPLTQSLPLLSRETMLNWLTSPATPTIAVQYIECISVLNLTLPLPTIAVPALRVARRLDAAFTRVACLRQPREPP